MDIHELHQHRRTQAMWYGWGACDHGKIRGVDIMAFGKAYADMYADHDAGHSQWMPSVMSAFRLWIDNGGALPTLWKGETVEYTGAANTEFAMRRVVKSG
jgi:hypothetical protein